jgi:hypothetical protein
MNFPYTHVAGDTLDFEVSVPDYPNTDGWTLKYYLTPRFTSPVQAQIVITASRERRRQLPGAGLAGHHGAWAPGAYGWSRTVEKTGARQTLASSEDQGEVLVRQNPATAAQGYDSRSHNRIVLEAIEACIQNRASTTQREMIEYTIGARGQKFDPADSRAALLELHSKYKWLVANEDAREAIAAGQPNPRNVGIRFTRP